MRNAVLARYLSLMCIIFITANNNLLFFSPAVEESAKIQTNLTKALFEDQDVTTVPARYTNDTVRAQLSMNLLKIIDLVWMHRLLFKPVNR